MRLASWINRWKSLSLLLKLIVVNVALFLTIRLAGVALMIFGGDIDPVINELALPSSLQSLASRPWTPVSYMFTHYDVLHILFNMLTLYWFGRIFLFRSTPRQLLALYLMGGFGGAVLYLLWGSAFGVSATLLGASAAVMAIVIADAILMPDFEVGLFLIGMVKLKWVAVAMVALFALGLVGDNAGGHVAHIGGILVGLWYGLMMIRGRDITRPLNRMLDFFANLTRRRGGPAKARFGRKKKVRRDSGAATRDHAADHKRIDAILDKIKTSGYSSLTPDEKRELFDLSNRTRHN